MQDDKEEPSRQVVQLLMEGRKIDAIKLAREQKGLGLKGAKDYVEQYMLRHPDRFPNKPGSSSGSGAWVLGLTVVAAIISWLLISKSP